MYKEVCKDYLQDFYDTSFKMLETCCGECWCCTRKKTNFRQI